LHEALSFWGCCAPVCIIDNTNLARLRGTGSAAVIVPEMINFARQYGFEFSCHEIGHANRKAGEERSFWTVETNFLPGRAFQSLEDLNEQGLQWATVRLEHRPQGKARLIPAKVFEHERACLTPLPPHLPAPYRIDKRGTDQYGFISFAANFYWVPGTHREDVQLLVYARSLKLYHHRQCLAHYPLPADGVRNKKFSPEGQPKPPHGPGNRRQPAREEEKRLRAVDPALDAYLDWVLPRKGHGRHRFLRSLLALSRKMTAELFIKSIQRAARYRIEELETIKRIAVLHLQEGSGTLPSAVVDEHLIRREAYLEGSLTDAPDLSVYEDTNIAPEEEKGAGPNAEPNTDLHTEPDTDLNTNTAPDSNSDSNPDTEDEDSPPP
jgi:hypothetical protein